MGQPSAGGHQGLGLQGDQKNGLGIMGEGDTQGTGQKNQGPQAQLEI